ncbi:MAG TPA: hypothetical protein VNM90_29965, partial [Haliangium sp.]|nr:hypothetical protein [Haliangium sp.]
MDEGKLASTPMENHAMLMCMQRRTGLQSRWLTAGLVASALLISGCGDDGGGGPPPPDAYAGDGVAPTVKIQFPPPSSLTDTPTITIRGTA